MKYIKEYEFLSKYREIPNKTYWTNEEIKELDRLHFYIKNVSFKISPKYYHSLGDTVDIVVKKVMNKDTFFYKAEINIEGKKTIERFHSFLGLIKHITKNKEKYGPLDHQTERDRYFRSKNMNY